MWVYEFTMIIAVFMAQGTVECEPDEQAIFDLWATENEEETEWDREKATKQSNARTLIFRYHSKTHFINKLFKQIK